MSLNDSNPADLIRPLNVKPDDVKLDDYSLTSDDDSEPFEVLKCNQRVMIFDGDAFTIHSPGYPKPAGENET